MEYGLYILAVGALIVGVFYKLFWKIDKPVNKPYGHCSVKVGDDGVKRFTDFYCEGPLPIHEPPPRNKGPHRGKQSIRCGPT